MPRLLDQPDRKECTSAAQRPISRPRQVHPTAGRVEHRERGLDVLGLEIAAERIHEQHDLAAILRSDRLLGALGSRNGRRQRGRLRRALKPCDAFRQPRQAWQSVAQIEQPRQARDDRRIARQIADQAVVPRQTPRAARAACTSIFMRAMSTPVGHSRRHALHETQSLSVSAISSETSASGPSWPVMASRSALARPRVTSRSSRVTR